MIHLAFVGLFAGLLLAGCATTMTEVERIAEQYDEDVYSLWTNAQGVELVGTCPFDTRDPRTFRRIVPPPCAKVAGTRDPRDVEFWKFTGYYVIQQTIYGTIPVSPRYKSGETWTLGVVGPRETCERVRLPLDKKPQGVAGDESTTMTEPCAGPFYFRRPASQP